MTFYEVHVKYILPPPPPQLQLEGPGALSLKKV